MNDRFATEKGASGSAEAEVDDGEVEFEVEAEGLVPGEEYELSVTRDFIDIFTFGPVTADEDGEVEFEGDIDLLSLLGPGTYRLDFFLTRPSGLLLFARDLLLACQPFVSATIVADD